MNAGSAISFAVFWGKVLGDLTSLAQMLYARHRGDPLAARHEITLIKDHWASMADDRAKIDAELAALKAQGK